MSQEDRKRARSSKKAKRRKARRQVRSFSGPVVDASLGTGTGIDAALLRLSADC